MHGTSRILAHQRKVRNIHYICNTQMSVSEKYVLNGYMWSEHLQMDRASRFMALVYLPYPSMYSLFIIGILDNILFLYIAYFLFLVPDCSKITFHSVKVE